MSQPTIGRASVTVAREAQIAALEQAIADARRGRGRLVFLIGEPGSGKTRLLREAETRATAAGMRVLAAEAPATMAAGPYVLVSSALRTWLRTRDAELEPLRPYMLGLATIVPELAEDERGSGLTPDQLHLLLLEGALQAFAVAARGTAAAVLFDDLHNGDPETIAFLTHAATNVATMPVVFIAAARAGEGSAESEARALARRGRATVIDVTPLDATGVASMIEQMLGGPPPSELVEEVAARTDGIPLFVEELLDAHATAGTLTRTDDGIEWRRPERRIVPKTILDMIRHRLWGLSDAAREVLWAAAVLGRADAPLIADVSALPTDAVAHALQEASDAGVLTTSGAFRHDLIREATYESSIEARRAELHRRSAEAIATRYGDDSAWLEERARHLVMIGDNEGAASLLLRAGRHYLSVHAFASATAVLERALSMTTAPALRQEIRDGLAAALTAHGRWEEALTVDGEDLGAHPTPLRLLRMARNALYLSRFDDADELLGRAPEAGANPAAVAALSALVALWRGDLQRADGEARRAIAIAERAEDDAALCDALDVAGRAADMLGRREEAIGAFRRWSEVAAGAGMTASHLQSLMELGNVAYMAHFDPDPLREVRRRAGDAGAYTTQVLADLSLTWVLGSNGAIAEAHAAADEAVELCRHFGLGLLPHALIALGWIAGRRVADSGRAMADEAVSLAPDDPDVVMLSEEDHGDSALRAGRTDEAVERYNAVAAAMRANPSAAASMAPFLRPSVLALAGRPADAKIAVEEARHFPARKRIWINDVLFSASEALVDGSAEGFERALDGARERAALERAIALTIGAQVLPGPHTVGWLRDALAVFDRAGAETDAARTRQLLRSLGERAPRVPSKRKDLPPKLAQSGVTRREAEVLAMIADGMANTEIAQTLYLSVRTVESHVSSLLMKLGAANRAALIALGISMKR